MRTKKPDGGVNGSEPPCEFCQLVARELDRRLTDAEVAGFEAEHFLGAVGRWVKVQLHQYNDTTLVAFIEMLVEGHSQQVRDTQETVQ